MARPGARQLAGLAAAAILCVAAFGGGPWPYETGAGGSGIYQPVCHLIENVADEEQFDWFEMFDRATTASSIYCKSFGANVELDWENDDGSSAIIESMVCTTAGVTDDALSGTDLIFAATDKAGVHITDVTAGATGVFTCLFFE